HAPNLRRAPGGRSITLSGTESEDQAAIRAVPTHADALVDADRSGVLGPDEQADGRDRPEQQAAEIAHPALRVALVPLRRVDPHLLHLHGRRRPSRRLGLEADRTVLHPEPRSSLVDLRARAPAKPFRIACQRIDADLFLVRG